MVECPNCAFRNQESDGFCGSCGLYLWPEGYARAAGAGEAAAVSGTRPPVPDRAGRVATIPPGRRPDGQPQGGPAPTTVQCRACGRPNAATRRFCGRCGNSLARATAYTAEPIPSAPAVREPWWRRLMWWHRRRALSVFRAGTRPGRRPERTLADPELAVTRRASPWRHVFGWLRRTLRRIWPDVFLILLILTLIALLFPEARRWVVDLFRKEPPGYLQPRYCQEPGAQIASLAQFPPAFACDNKPETFFTTSLGDPANPADTVARRQPRLWVDFSTPVKVHAFHITASEVEGTELLSSALLREGGRPAQICVKFYPTPTMRDRHYELVGAKQPTAGFRQSRTLQFPRPLDGKDTATCSGLDPEKGPFIDDDAAEHRWSFEDLEVLDVGAVSIEIRKTHNADLDDRATAVYVSGLEFFGEEMEPEEDGKEDGDRQARGTEPATPYRQENTRTVGGRR